MNPERNPRLIPAKPNFGIKSIKDWFALRNATQIGAVDKNEPQPPLSKRLKSILGLSVLAAACGGTTTEPPTTSTTVIETPITQPPTTVPPTEVTTATSTTVAEPTPTTEVKDITKASGNIFNGGVSIDNLGYVDTTDFPENDIYEYVMLVIPTALNIRTTDFQGEQKEVYTIEVSLGAYEDGSPYIREYMIDIPNEDDGFQAIKKYFRSFDNFSSEDQSFTVFNNELVTLINQMINEGREIGIYVPYWMEPSILERNTTFPRWREVMEKKAYNDNTYNDLINRSDRGIIKVNHEGEPDFGSISLLLLFPPVGGW